MPSAASSMIYRSSSDSLTTARSDLHTWEADNLFNVLWQTKTCVAYCRARQQILTPKVRENLHRNLNRETK